MNEIRIVIGGCRNYNDYNSFEEYVTNILSKYDNFDIITIISGHCSGVDRMAEQFAEGHGCNLEIYPAEWNKYGKAAGPKRNRKMVDLADVVIAFWDKKSKGTKSLINNAEISNKMLYINYITRKT